MADACVLWACAGRQPGELEQLARVIAERAFISKIWPTQLQIAEWRVLGRGTVEIAFHVERETGRFVTRQTAERLWRLFTSQPEPRKRATIADFVRGIPEVWKCKQCGIDAGPFEVDHIIPLQKGGPDSITNLQVLCVTCNRKKGDRLDPQAVNLQFEKE